MSGRTLKECTCTHEQLLEYGYKPKDISSHHILCKTRFKTLIDWKSAHTNQNTKDEEI